MLIEGASSTEGGIRRLLRASQRMMPGLPGRKCADELVNGIELLQHQVAGKIGPPPAATVSSSAVINSTGSLNFLASNGPGDLPPPALPAGLHFSPLLLASCYVPIVACTVIRPLRMRVFGLRN